MDTIYGYEDGYASGWEEGRYTGYSEGIADAVNEYDTRIKLLWAEIQTLHARVDHLTTLICGDKK